MSKSTSALLARCALFTKERNGFFPREDEPKAVRVSDEISVLLYTFTTAALARR
jgi:hypothetical protein